MVGPQSVDISFQLVDTGPRLAETAKIGPTRVIFCRLRDKIGKSLSSSAKSVEIGPKVVHSGQRLISFCRSRPLWSKSAKIDRLRADFGRFRLRLPRIWPKFDRLRKLSGRCRPNQAGFRRNLGEFDKIWPEFDIGFRSENSRGMPSPEGVLSATRGTSPARLSGHLVGFAGGSRHRLHRRLGAHRHRRGHRRGLPLRARRLRGHPGGHRPRGRCV